MTSQESDVLARLIQGETTHLILFSKIDTKLGFRFGAGDKCDLIPDDINGISKTHFTITLNDNHECPLSITDKSTYGVWVTPCRDKNDPFTATSY